MEITEYIYEGVVEYYYKKSTWADSNRAGHTRNKRGESTSYKNHPAKEESSEKRQKRYLYSSKRKLKTCIIHGPGHYYNECKVLGYFGAN